MDKTSTKGKHVDGLETGRYSCLERKFNLGSQTMMVWRML